MEQSQNKAVNITSLKLGLYRVRFLPVDAQELTKYYSSQCVHFFNGSKLACNWKNNKFFGKCSPCDDANLLRKDQRFDEAKNVYSRKLFFSTVSIVDENGAMSAPFVLQFSKQLNLRIKKTQEKYGSICDPNGGYLFDIVIRMKDDKWKTYEDSEIHNGQPFPLTGIDWKQLLLDTSVSFLESMPFQEGKEFYKESCNVDENSGFTNPAFNKSNSAQQAQPVHTPIEKADVNSLPGGSNSAYAAIVPTNFPGSGNTVTPVVPVTSITPLTPVVPLTPVAPLTPVVPVTSITPSIPVVPVTPVAPITTPQAPWNSPTGTSVNKDLGTPNIPPCHASIPGKSGYKPGDKACDICDEQKSCGDIKQVNEIPVQPAEIVNKDAPVAPTNPDDGTTFPDVGEVSADVQDKLNALNKR